ncbi:MAG: 1-hydroxycarotenoid 3,4-desaturase CrtD [Pseudomonadota bacterium]
MSDGRVAVIGAGVGGLAAAIRLAAEGVGVDLYEAAAYPGGKMRQVTVAGRQLDAGPTVLTMDWVFRELFEAAGARLDDYVTLEPADILARHAWPDGSRFDLLAGLEATMAEVARLSGAEEAARYRAFAAQTAADYTLFRDSFIAASRPSPLSILTRIGPARWRDLIAAQPSANLWRRLGRYFHDPRLRQLFGRYATYCGSSPFAAPATLMLIAHVERAGVWRVRGGMHQLAAALAALAGRMGVQIYYRTPVAEILTRAGRIHALRLADGNTVGAGAVVFNGDAGALSAGLLGPATRRATPKVPVRRRSLSAIAWSVVGRTQGLPLSHHTVVFGTDYREEFEAIFRRRTVPAEPTAYLCALDRPAATAAPETSGAERLHIHINAPADGDGAGLNDREIERCRERTWALMARCGLEIAAEPTAISTTGPAAFERLFPGTGGALYGQTTHGPVASFLRPTAATRVPGLYLAGGSAHPGAGIPMAALSGKLAAERLMADRVSTKRSRPAAISGGISMRSRTTGATG